VKKIIILLAIFQSYSFAADDFFQIRLPDLQNKTFSFSDLKKNKATAIIILLSDCPASQSYTLTLSKLAKKYSSKSISFVGIFPGAFSTDDELKKFQADYKIVFPLVKDPYMTLCKKLNATTAPGCFVIDKNGNTIYQGRIDDWLYAVGKKKPVITENNLDDALQSVVKNMPVKIKETNPIGCILEYE
jgi:thiol-disulfide isomerase/thioredoxin